MEVNFIAQRIKQDLILRKDNAVINLNIAMYHVYWPIKFNANLSTHQDAFIVFIMIKFMIGIHIKDIYKSNNNYWKVYHKTIKIRFLIYWLMVNLS
jgi:hypothetical protein